MKVQPSFGCSSAGRPRQAIRVSRRTGKGVIGHAAVDSQPIAGVKTLKEWSVVISALRDGEQTVLLRKGGIKEPAFKPEPEFLLFPTAFHVAEDVLKDGVATRYALEMMFDPKKEETLHMPVYAKVTGAWTTKDPAVISALSPLHVGTDAFMESKLKWRGVQPLTIMELRTYVLQNPVSIPVEENLFGCFSWLDLPVSGQLSLESAKASISDEEFQRRQSQLRVALKGLSVEELHM